MTKSTQADNGRRSFFLLGSTALGAGLASAAASAGTMLFDDTLSLQEQLAQLHRQLDAMEDREAIRLLQHTYLDLVEKRAFDTVVELFSDDAVLELHGVRHQGREQAIRKLFCRDYALGNGAEMHTAFRPDQSGAADAVSINADRAGATASLPVRVEVSRNLAGGSTLEEMARLQGQHAARRWESGRFEMTCSRAAGQWKISRLRYRTG